MEKYTILSEVGRGAFGIVYKAQNKDTKEIVAIKQMVQEYETWDECVNLRELKALQKLSHNNIVKLREVFRVKKKLSFVFEYVERNIFKLYESAKEEGLTQVSEPTIKIIVYQIAAALSYMHKHGFFHRDLKPENLLISSDNTVKLIDLGLAREIRSRPPYTDYVSTRWYRAPEILLRSTNYNSPVDIFALGCIMAELFLLKPLFNGSNEIDQISKITAILGTPSKSDWPDGFILAQHKYLTFPSYPPIPLAQVIPACPPDAINLLTEMLRWDPSKRITATKILSHPYFADLQLQDILTGETAIRSHSPETQKHSHSKAAYEIVDQRPQMSSKSTAGLQQGTFSSAYSSKLDQIFDFMGADDDEDHSKPISHQNVRQPSQQIHQHTPHHSASVPAMKSRVVQPEDFSDIEQEILGTLLPPSRVLKPNHQGSSSMFTAQNGQALFAKDDFNFAKQKALQSNSQQNDIYRFEGVQQKATTFSQNTQFPQQGITANNNVYKQNLAIYNFDNVPNRKLPMPQ